MWRRRVPRQTLRFAACVNKLYLFSAATQRRCSLPLAPNTMSVKAKRASVFVAPRFAFWKALLWLQPRHSQATAVSIRGGDSQLQQLRRSAATGAGLLLCALISSKCFDSVQ